MILDEKQLSDMWDDWQNGLWSEDDLIPVMDTCKALWKIARAAQKIPRYCCARDECLNYESDPECHKRLEVALKSLPPSDEGEKK